MYQIFYIDMDEEITSVIDRLKKSKTTENFFVVSPRSLILQSVVSLKLLKREAAKEKKQIAIVVNDNEAKIKIEKAGILALSSIKGLEDGEEVRENFSPKMEIKNSNKSKDKNIMKKEINVKKTRLKKIGTDSFYGRKEEAPNNSPAAASQEIEKIGDIRTGAPQYASNPARVMPESDPFKIKNTSDMKRKKPVFSYVPEKTFENNAPALEPPKAYSPNRVNNFGEMDPYKEKLVEGFFNPETKKPEMYNQPNRIGETPIKNGPVSHGMRKVIFSFVVICLLLALLVGAYLFIPKAIVVATIKNETRKFDLEVKGDKNQSEVVAKELLIPAQVIEIDDSLSQSFKSTGKKSSASDVSQKAKGKITIYNEYNSEPQQLVATTRLLSKEGKLFRLVKGTTVPGMNGSNPGTVEVDVIADQPGEDYNIPASEFKIPGFGGGPKYDKFYAKSPVSMSGGGAGASSGIAIVSQSDLDNAKKETEAKLKDQLEEKVKVEIGKDTILLQEASEKNISESLSSSRANEASSDFTYSVKGKIKAVVFSEKNLKKLAGDIYNEANKEKSISDYSPIKINYGISSEDLNTGSINIKINAEVPIKYSLDKEDFKRKLLGKNEDQIKEMLGEYPQIEKINIDFWPKFLSQRVPQYEKRVDVVVENASN
ncbi:MAG: hypothetical protein V1804_03590 [Patescibacteria group bacterium]